MSGEEAHLLNLNGSHEAHSSQDNVEAFKRRVMVVETIQFMCHFFVWPIEGWMRLDALCTGDA